MLPLHRFELSSPLTYSQLSSPPSLCAYTHSLVFGIPNVKILQFQWGESVGAMKNVGGNGKMRHPPGIFFSPSGIDTRKKWKINTTPGTTEQKRDRFVHRCARSKYHTFAIQFTSSWKNKTNEIYKWMGVWSVPTSRLASVSFSFFLSFSLSDNRLFFSLLRPAAFRSCICGALD